MTDLPDTTPTPTSPPPRRRRGLLLLGALVVVALGVGAYMVTSSDDDDGGGSGDRRSSGNDDDTTSETLPAGDGNAPEGPDLSQELATSVSGDGTLDLVVNEVRQDGDRVTVWVTITNNGEDRFRTTNGFTDPTLDPIARNVHADVSGMYLVDWEAGKAYYPMAIDEDTCLCSKGRFEIEPEASLSVFAVYNGVGELTDATVVLPEFLPADGLAPS